MSRKGLVGNAESRITTYCISVCSGQMVESGLAGMITVVPQNSVSVLLHGREYDAYSAFPMIFSVQRFISFLSSLRHCTSGSTSSPSLCRPWKPMARIVLNSKLSNEQSKNLAAICKSDGSIWFARLVGLENDF